MDLDRDILGNADADGKLQWTEVMTTLLLSEIDRRQEDFKSQPQKNVWKRICATINEFEYNITAEQCCSKWKSLKKKYKQIKDNNNRSGAAKQQWVHFETVDNILKTRPEINPVFHH